MLKYFSGTNVGCSSKPTKFLFSALISLATLSIAGGKPRKIASPHASIAVSEDPIFLKVEGDPNSYLILDSLPMGHLTDYSEFRLLPGAHKIQVHHHEYRHFDTTLILSPGMKVFTKDFSKTELLQNKYPPMEKRK